MVMSHGMRAAGHNEGDSLRVQPMARDEDTY
jgi:hypothetical protein